MSSVSKEVKIGIDNDYPMKATIAIKNKFILKYFVAPIVDNSEVATPKKPKIEVG